jgi:single-strand DNA-binding protein
MNVVTLTGRLVKDPEVRYTNGGMSVAKFTVAVDRDFKKEGGQTADFPSVVAFGKTAEFIEKYFHKGKRIEIVGRLQTGSYEKDDGTKVYTTDVLAERVGFGESKSAGGSQEPKSKPAGNDFVNVHDNLEGELPFLS